MRGYLNERRTKFNDGRNRTRKPARYQRRAHIGYWEGKKTGLYGCAFLVLAVVIVFIVLALTGIYNPFEGMEGVGP